jgi:glycosyltransferase involved in cell wall biosynthesis
MVARLERWKGAHVFVSAAKFVMDEYPDATLFIVGGPHSLDVGYSEEVRALLHKSGYGARFILAGQRSMAETLVWQTAADVIVHPVIGVEPFGMAVVEAMARGKVVVSSNAGGPSEIINNGVDGILIDSDNPELLGATLNHLLRNAELRAFLERNASARGRSFSVATFAGRFEELVEGVVRG